MHLFFCFTVKLHILGLCIDNAISPLKLMYCSYVIFMFIFSLMLLYRFYFIANIVLGMQTLGRHQRQSLCCLG